MEPYMSFVGIIILVNGQGVIGYFQGFQGWDINLVYHSNAISLKHWNKNRFIGI